MKKLNYSYKRVEENKTNSTWTMLGMFKSVPSDTITRIIKDFLFKLFGV